MVTVCYFGFLKTDVSGMYLLYMKIALRQYFYLKNRASVHFFSLRYLYITNNDNSRALLLLITFPGGLNGFHRLMLLWRFVDRLVHQNFPRHNASRQNRLFDQLDQVRKIGLLF